MEVKCPKCGGQTSLRTRSKDRRKFHVCIRYPECKGKIEGSLDEDLYGESPRRSDNVEESPVLSASAIDIIQKIFFTLGGLSAGVILIIAGAKMQDIQSVAAAGGSGGSIAEAYYHEMGLGFIGLGIFVAALLIGMAWKRS